MASELSYETSDDTSENELLDRSLSVWRGWSAIELEDFTPIALDIHTACSIGHYEWVRTIIGRNEGIDLDRKNHGGWTPLMYACYIGHDNIVSLLITAGCCNMNAKNPRGLTPLMLAASCGNESVARTLIRRGANKELLDKSGWTALFHATYAGHQNFVAFLIEAEANKDAVDPNTGLTPFMVAASEGHEIIVQLFLQNGVNTHAKAFNGDMARSLALLNGYMKIVSLIDNQELPVGRLRAEADLCSGSPHERGNRARGSSQINLLNKAPSPSIMDGPEAIARMISRSRQPDTGAYTDVEVPKGYVTFPAPQEDKKETRLSYRDVTSPINQEDYRDSSGSREFDDFNDDSNAFTKTGAITIKSSSSSSGGLMAALGLSLDSDEGHLDSQTDRALKPSLPLKNQLTSGRDSVTENEQLEYDVDGDSSRPVDSHSPSLNDTSSLSSSDQRQRCGVNDKSNAELPSEEQSALRDYFPLDASFPPGIGEDPAIVKPQRQHGKAILKADGNLPKENMSHTEIVNRFLDKLTLDNPEHVNEGNDVTGQLGEIEQHSDLHGPQDKRIQKCRIDSRTEANSHEIPENIPKVSSSSGFVKSLGNQQHSIPEMSNNPHETLSYPVEIPIASTSQSQPQQWVPHPPLNHHHPLHSRHKHHHHQYYSNTPIPGMQDVNSNMYSILQSANPMRPSVQKQQGVSLPYLNSLQQQYYYTDLPSAPYAHLQPEFNQTPFQPLPTEGNTAVNLHHFYAAANDGDQHASSQFVTNSALPPSTPTFPSNKESTSQSVHSISDWGAAGDPLAVPSGGFLGCQAPVHPSVRMPPPLGQPPPLPALPHLPPDSAAASSPSVIIPGHFTSQPISAPQVLNTAPQSSVVAHTDGPADLKDMLNQLGLLKYLDKFEEQDVDLQVFLSLTDNDLKELGIKLFGPRKKMTNAIARWHSSAPTAKNNLEQAYADKLEGEMQEMAIQLNQAYENEERLKAQVSQEQQLRSVTESCLMEERAGWEQAGQMLQTTRGKLRTLGEQQSRLRHYQKELRKQFETWASEMGNRGSCNGINNNWGNDEHPQSPNQSVTHTERAGEGTDSSHSEIGTKNDGFNGNNAGSVSTKVSAAAEQMKRSDKCLKEMMQTLSSLVLNTDHILKSVQSLGNAGKDVT
ncbi:hypothetical protein EGW08_005541 [Elysia chlorotica]|uniref:SAM domain-containing protein n=1 Tax=Elysia chlorotica TaxID=188477 RepID=A0A433TYN1_ELYCH|nr:hypothetical protein EGW08_005541 [Elysia chlorotica]